VDIHEDGYPLDSFNLSEIPLSNVPARYRQILAELGLEGQFGDGGLTDPNAPTECLRQPEKRILLMLGAAMGAPETGFL
jgi:hypothetical protein